MCFIYISLFFKNSKLHTYEKFYYFFALYISGCPTINFQFLIMSKWLAKHISTKVSFKITIWKRHVYIVIRWPWIWNQYYQLGFLKWWFYFNDGFAFIWLATRLNSQNTYETEIHNDIWHINLYMNIGISNWRNWSYEPMKMTFLTLYQFLTRLLISKHLNLIST